jgi:translation elongation factor P/translation initiation factor 5A
MGSASELSKGSYFLVGNEPVCVTRKEVVAYGTHSHSKLKIYYKSLEGRGEKSITLGHGDKVDILDIIRKTGQVIAKLNNQVQIMDTKSYETFTASAEQELFNELNENDEVIFVAV